jgi:hypothetical protein
MPQDAFHRARPVDDRHEPQAAAAPWALEHVDPKRSSHQIGPEIRVKAPPT